MGTELSESLVTADVQRERAAAGEEDPTATLRTIAGLAARGPDDPDVVSVWIFEGEAGPLRCAARQARAQGGESGEGGVQEVDLSDAPAFLRAVSERRVLAVADAAADLRTRELDARWWRPCGITSVLVAPCRRDGHVFALLVYGRSGEPRRWSRAIQAEAQQTARLVGAVAGAAALDGRTPDDRLLETTSRELRFLEQVFEQLPSGVILTDAHGRVLLQNAAGQQIMGGRAPHHVRAWDPSVVGIDLPASELPLGRVLRDGEQAVREEFALRLPDGTDAWLAVHSGPVRDDEGEMIAAVAAFEDITELRRTALALEEELRVRERFMAVLGHDLRTPAAAVLMSAQLLQRSEGLDAGQEKLVQRIVSSGRRMERMIRDLLDMGSIRADRVRLVRTRCDLAALCEEVVSELRSTWPGRAVDLDLASPADGVWDAGRLAQVLSNLIGNALAHGSAAEPVRVRLRASAGEVAIEIRNVAPPLPPELVRHLFQPFHAVERPSPHSGLGLGLFISHAIVTAHGGTIALASEGSEVVVTLRLPRDGAGSAPAR